MAHFFPLLSYLSASASIAASTTARSLGSSLVCNARSLRRRSSFDLVTRTGFVFPSLSLLKIYLQCLTRAGLEPARPASAANLAYLTIYCAGVDPGASTIPPSRCLSHNITQDLVNTILLLLLRFYFGGFGKGIQ